jgi:hypothetical protein
MQNTLPGAEIGKPNGCLGATLIVLLYVGCVLGGLYWLYRYIWP